MTWRTYGCCCPYLFLSSVGSSGDTDLIRQPISPGGSRGREASMAIGLSTSFGSTQVPDAGEQKPVQRDTDAYLHLPHFVPGQPPPRHRPGGRRRLAETSPKSISSAAACVSHGLRGHEHGCSAGAPRTARGADGEASATSAPHCWRAPATPHGRGPRHVAPSECVPVPGGRTRTRPPSAHRPTPSTGLPAARAGRVVEGDCSALRKHRHCSDASKANLRREHHDATAKRAGSKSAYLKIGPTRFVEGATHLSVPRDDPEQ